MRYGPAPSRARLGKSSATLSTTTARAAASAKSEGKTLGRPSKTTSEQRAEISSKYEQGESVSALARFYSVSRANILNVVKSS
ncbi:helix-turn-helix domain-containing protein [Janthinobacterium sp. PC23-8]|uniref:helix-turn-helix domain-containing protein n=1 Tax=Janthinobacterium sp. PC23-8 TaxID=2012679 RepID=UPI0034E93960